MMAAAAGLGRPLAARNDVLTVLPGPLSDEELAARIEASAPLPSSSSAGISPASAR